MAFFSAIWMPLIILTHRPIPVRSYFSLCTRLSFVSTMILARFCIVAHYPLPCHRAVAHCRCDSETLQFWRLSFPVLRRQMAPLLLAMSRRAAPFAKYRKTDRDSTSVHSLNCIIYSSLQERFSGKSKERTLNDGCLEVTKRRVSENICYS